MHLRQQCVIIIMNQGLSVRFLTSLESHMSLPTQKITYGYFRRVCLARWNVIIEMHMSMTHGF